MMHTLKLDDMELTALITHLEGQSEMMVESRLNSSFPDEPPDREELLLNKVHEKAFTLGWEYQRMGLSGRETYDEICHLLNMIPEDEVYMEI